MTFISNEKWKSLRGMMIRLGIIESEIKERFILGSGSGGQKINKTHSTVSLIYKGYSIVMQKSRSRDSNRYFARVSLCNKVAEDKGIQTKESKNRDKKIKQKKRRLRKSKKKLDVLSENSTNITPISK